jgi:hypothetical protein
MNHIHRSLHLQHHRHTGRLLHHRHTSYRGLAIVLGLASITIAGLNVLASVTADSLYVYATVPAPIPTTPASITSPNDGAKTNTTLLVHGTCPAIDPRVIIAIFVDGTDAGSVACDSSYTFSVPIDVTVGQHTLVAKSYTITGDVGPDSSAVHIQSEASSPVTNQPPSSSTYPVLAPDTTAPLSVTTDSPFIVFGPSKDATWMGTITGGTLPYHIHIDWGDASSTTYTITTSGRQFFRHHYRSMQPHDITFLASDARNRQVTMHLAAVTPYIPPTSGSLLTTSPSSPFSGSGMFGVYGAYLLLLSGFGWLWIRAHKFAYAKISPQPAGSRAGRRHRQSRASNGVRRKPVKRSK